MSNPVYGIRLDPRQAWAWHRLGNHNIRQWLAPEGICVECSARKAKPATRNGWFCYVCQDMLDQKSLLPDPESKTLLNQNQDLRAEVNNLRSQLKAREQKPERPAEQQLSLFRETDDRC
jgi:hypothetical protein